MTESKLCPSTAIYNQRVLAGDGWIQRIEANQVFRIVDLEGNQAVDTLFYNANDTSERYSATDTIVGQRNIYLTTGTTLLSNLRRPMLTIIADTCGRHDTLGGACAAESNQVRYSLDKRWMHSCRDTFMLAISRGGPHLTKCDITHNINFFMNVPVTAEGKLSFEDGVSAGGRYVELRAEMDLICLISNCPQLNNPCNGYDPTPVRLLIWD